MHFGKIHILLVVLIFSLDHVRSDDNYDAAINDEAVDDQADEGVDDQAYEGVDDQADEGVHDQADEGVDDQADEGVDDQADEGVDDQADEGVDELADDAVNDDTAIADVADTTPLNADSGVADDNAAVADDDGHVIEANGGNAPETSIVVDKSGPCKVGTYFRVDCNVCFCYEPNVQGCTTTDCSKQSKKTLLSNPATRLKFKKLRDSATGCVPGEKIKQGNCECSCTLPSVITCPKNCL